ncbi:hypothetical protein SAMN05192583_2672 [Sphingomonas gellani]|uniref:Uncharacterized protein n=1 Tax=Sphingomonas gellani TaxID=1166340 RepID=A0A1H8G316_9SPHN|nr:hypothetical protein [Sphingomonas gellani]SEN38184.1 hypothetical protein SAMN05192583_2672 [Sphingomonas gellani]
MPPFVPVILLAVAADLPAKPICQDARIKPVDAAGPARPHALGKEPPAQAIYTVLRSTDGCSRPVPVSDRQVGTPAPQR